MGGRFFSLKKTNWEQLGNLIVFDESHLLQSEKSSTSLLIYPSIFNLSYHHPRIVVKKCTEVVKCIDLLEEYWNRRLLGLLCQNYANIKKRFINSYHLCLCHAEFITISPSIILEKDIVVCQNILLPEYITIKDLCSSLQLILWYEVFFSSC